MLNFLIFSYHFYCTGICLKNQGTFLGVQWLTLCSPNALSGSIPGQGTRSHMPQLRSDTAKLLNISKKNQIWLYMYETYTTIGLKHMNEMLYLKGGRTQQNKQTHQVCQILTLCPICFRLHIYFSFFGQKKQYCKELIRMPPSFPLLQCHGEHDLQLYLTKPNFLQNKCPNVYTHQP